MTDISAAAYFGITLSAVVAFALAGFGSMMRYDGHRKVATVIQVSAAVVCMPAVFGFFRLWVEAVKWILFA